MSNNTDSIKKFDELLARLVDNDLSAAEIEQLIELSQQNSSLKTQLRDQLMTDNLLSQSTENNEELSHYITETLNKSVQQSKANTFENKVISAIFNAEKSTPSGPKKLKRQYLPWTVSGISMAACVLLSVLFYLNYHSGISPFLPDKSSNHELQYTSVAVIANAVGFEDSQQFNIGDSIKPGEIKIEEGFLELEFYRGAQLKIAGPAHIEVINDERIRLISGKVMTDVPTVAIGFTIDTPNSEVVDLGTAIGVEVNENGQSQVHVFEGLVEARSYNGDGKRLIEKGNAVNFIAKNTQSWVNEKAQQAEFSEFNNIEKLTGSALNLKHQKWLQLKDKILADTDLVTYYDFEPNPEKPRVLHDISKTADKQNGAIVGAQWGDGPWQNKHALNFKRASDRVRVEIDEKFTSFTLAAWVQIDSLDRTFNSIILTDGFEPGDIHWQLANFNKTLHGAMVLGLNSTLTKSKNYNYSPFYTMNDSGTWYHLAVSVDQQNNKVSLYIDGKQVAMTPLTNPSEFWQIGEASIGNWDPQQKTKPIRNLNGSIAELIIFKRALTKTEIQAMALQ